MKFVAHSIKNLFVIILVLLACSVFGIQPTPTHAQNGGLVVNVSPRQPGPFQNITITVEDYSRNINSLNISWSLDGKVAQTGIGLKEYKLESGALGTVNNVSINIGGVVRTVSIRPALVDLLWQSDTYTPPFYAGKALHSNQDPITIVAEPFFLNSKKERLDPTKLIYDWEVDGKASGTDSGYGKKTLTITPSILIKPVEVEVIVSSTDGVYASSAMIVIPDTKPEIIAYENHPLYGIIFQRALNNKDFIMAGSEAKISAIPFFFSNQQKKSNKISYDWKLNNSAISEKKEEIVFRKPDNVRQGSSRISLTAKNSERFMQFSDVNFNISFTNESETANQGVF